MGLINIGKSEGTEIILLFSGAVSGSRAGTTLSNAAPTMPVTSPEPPVLETLNIFGVDAAYRLRGPTIEGVDDYKTVERQIAIKVCEDHSRRLLIPHWEKTDSRKPAVCPDQRSHRPGKVDLSPE